VRQRVSQNLSGLRTRRAIVPSGNVFSFHVATHAWERNFVSCSVDTRFATTAKRLKLKASHCIILVILNRVHLEFLRFCNEQDLVVVHHKFTITTATNVKTFLAKILEFRDFVGYKL